MKIKSFQKTNFNALLTWCIFALYSLSHASGPLDVELTAQVKKIDSYWILNPYTLQPVRVVPSIKVKISAAIPLKRIPIENDVTIIDEKVSIIGKGYKLVPESTPNEQMKELLGKISDWGKKTTGLQWAGGPQSEAFMFRSKNLINRLKGPTNVKLVLSVKCLEDFDKCHSASPVEISFKDQTWRSTSYKELWDRPRLRNENFNKLYSNLSGDQS